MKSNFPPSVLIRDASITFTCPGLGIRFGLARSSARLGSGWLFGWTQGPFRFSTRDTRALIDLTRGSVQFAQGPDQLGSRPARLDPAQGPDRGSAHRTSGLGTVCSRHGSARGSAHRTSGLGSAHYSRFSLPRLVNLNRLGDRLEARRISSMLGSAELRARLGARFWAQLKIGWGWGLVVQLGLAQGSVRLT